MSSTSIAPARLEQIQQLLADTRFRGGELFPLAGDASFRRYIRIRKGDETAMLMDAPPDKEDVRPYIAVAEYIHAQGYSAPFIHARNIGAGLLLLEDLGDDSFTAILKNAPLQTSKELERELYGAAIDLLAQWHDGNRGFSNPQALAVPIYNDALLLQETALFTDWYLPQVVGKEKALALRQEYKALWQKMISDANLSSDLWVHRDYHADNLMWLPQREGAKRIGLLDFQDGVYGDAAYDLVSLLEDARRDVPRTLADAMLDRYIAASGVDRERFLTAYAVLGAQRNSKIIGIFSRLAARDNKFHYLHYLPRVWGHLEYDLTHPVLAPLKQWLDRHVPVQARGVIEISHSAQQLLTA